MKKIRYVCPICEREVDDSIIPYHKNVEKQILDMIKKENPRWIDEDGSSEKTVDYYRALLSNQSLK